MADKSLTPIDLPELSSAPASPASGFHRFYAKTDGKAYSKSSAGTEYDLTAGVSLTTTGTSGAATLVGTTLNIPVYQSALTNPVTGTGTAGQVAYWSGTTTQTGNAGLQWDSTTGFLAVEATATASKPLIYLKQATNNTGLLNYFKFDTRSGGEFSISEGGSSSTVSMPSFTIKSAGQNGIAGGFNGIIPSANDTLFAGYAALIFDASKTPGTYLTSSNLFIFRNYDRPAMTIDVSGNTSIGNFTTAIGARLHVRGSGTTSATTALLVQNSTPTANFTIRDDGGYAFRNGTVGLAQTGYTTFTNLTTDRTCDANATTVEELADILGTLIVDLKTKGIISA